MAVTYTNLDAALSRAIERSAGYATSNDSALLSELLQLLSAVSTSGVTHYRPYLVAAYFLEQNPKVQLLKQESDTHYTMLANAILSLRSLQSAYDRVNELFVKPHLEAVAVKSRPLPSAIIPTIAYL